MIDRQTAPLEIARKVLHQFTIERVRLDRNLSGPAYRILDRWALNSPDALLVLEGEGLRTENLLIRRLKQQNLLEERALCSDAAVEMRRRGMSEWEILEMLGVDTELRLHRKMSYQERMETLEAVKALHTSMSFEGEDDELEEARKVLMPLTVASIQDEPWYCEEVWTLLNHWARAFPEELLELEENGRLDQTVSLGQAREVLSPETIAMMRKKTEDIRDYLRLNEWAESSPELLKRVEAKGILEQTLSLKTASTVLPEYIIQIYLTGWTISSLETHILLNHWAITRPDMLKESLKGNVFVTLTDAICSVLSRSESENRERLLQIIG